MAHNVADLNTQLEIYNAFSEWSGIILHIPKCRLTCCIHEIQALKREKDRDCELQTSIANIGVGHTPISIMSQDDPLPGGYLGIALIASLSPKAHLQWTIDTISTISKSVLATPSHRVLNNASSYTEPILKSCTHIVLWLFSHHLLQPSTPNSKSHAEKPGNYPKVSPAHACTHHMMN